MTVAQAAETAGLSRSWVDALIRAGKVDAHRVGHQYVIDDPSQLLALPRRRGRPMTPKMAWALMLHADGQDAPWATAQEKSRIRAHMAKLELDPGAATRLQALVVNRAARLSFHSPQPRALLDDADVLPSGISDPRAGMSSGDGAEGYVWEDDLRRVVRRHLLVTPTTNRPNVWLHVSPFVPASALRLQVAADLAEHGGPRERTRALALVRQVMRTEPR